MSDHYDDGTRQHDEHGTVFACGCGELFAERSERDDHIAENTLSEEALERRTEEERAFARMERERHDSRAGTR